MSSPPAPDFEDAEYQPQDRAAPALKKGDNAPPSNAPSNPPALLRGEVFDFDLDNPGEIQARTASQKRAGAWFVAALAGLFCAYNIGAYVGQKSKIAAPLGPFTAQKEDLKPVRLQIAGRVKTPASMPCPAARASKTPSSKRAAPSPAPI